MTRTFIAVDIPERLAQELAALQEPLRATQAVRATFVDASQMHVTLAFLGELDDAQLQEVQEQLRAVDADSFKTHVEEVAIKNNRIVWASLSPVDWQELHDAVADALPSYTADRPVFDAHVTLARIKDLRDANALRARVSELTVPGEEFVVEQFLLYTSQLTRDGPEYVLRASYALG